MHRKTDPWPAEGQLVPCLARRKDGCCKSLLLLAELAGKALGGALLSMHHSNQTRRMAAEERLNSHGQIQDIVQAALFSERLLAGNIVLLFPAPAIHASGARPPSSQLYRPVEGAKNVASIQESERATNWNSQSTVSDGSECRRQPQRGVCGAGSPPCCCVTSLLTRKN